MMPVNALPSAFSNGQIHCKIHQTFHAISFQLVYLIKVQNVKYPPIIQCIYSNHTCIDISYNFAWSSKCNVDINTDFSKFWDENIKSEVMSNMTGFNFLEHASWNLKFLDCRRGD